jgi:hypothetical protein
VPQHELPGPDLRVRTSANPRPLPQPRHNTGSYRNVGKAKHAFHSAARIGGAGASCRGFQRALPQNCP